MTEFDRAFDKDEAFMGGYDDPERSRFSPGRILDGIIDYTRGRPGELTADVGRSMRRNAVPLTLIGAGVLWMITEGRRGPLRRQAEAARDSTRGAIERARETAKDAGETARDTALEAGRRLRETTRGAADAAGRYGHQLRSEASRGGRNAWRTVERSYQENPVALGVIVALGAAAVALSIPATRKENRWFGDMRDEAAGKIGEAARNAREVGKAALETAREEAVNAGKATLDTAKREARVRGLDLAEDDAGKDVRAEDAGRKTD